MMTTDYLLQRAKALNLYGLLAHWEEINQEKWVENLITWEEFQRANRSLEQRIKAAHLGRFKPLIEFDWTWPRKCDRETIEELMQLSFLKSNTNIVLCGPNGVGKSTIASNIAHQTVINGSTALFTTAAKMLNELASKESATTLRHRVKYYVKPSLLCIDEVGYLSYSNRHADLLFEIISQRYEKKSTLVTTNKPFSEWNDIFPNAACVVSLVDRLVHNSEIISIEADSYRLKEAKEKSLERKKFRKNKNDRST